MLGMIGLGFFFVAIVWGMAVGEAVRRGSGGHRGPMLAVVAAACIVVGALLGQLGLLSMVLGVVGADLSIEQGYEAARYALLSSLAAIKYALGDLDRVQQAVQLIGFVNSAPGFHEQPRVINGATDLLVELYGDRGKPTRAAIGCQGLALGHSVEVVLTVLFSGEGTTPPLARDHYVK